ncbi:MAG: PAS domain-containing protein [Balneolaceae bacterium]|nr:PAS domain-containing protein [Balneolaceae bacterium]
MDQDQLLFERNPIPMLIYEVDTLKILKVNNAARQKYGYSSEEFTQLTIEDIRPEEELQSLHESLSDRKEGLNRERVVRHKRKNGNQFYAQINSHSFRYKNYKSRLVAIIDITDEVNARIKAEKAFRELEPSDQEKSAGYHKVGRESTGHGMVGGC